MSPTATEDQKTTLKVIDRWKIAAAEAIDDIDGWRDFADERSKFHGDSRRQWRKLDDGFYRDTTVLMSTIATDYPRLDPKPLQVIYRVVHAWYTEQNMKHVGEQSVLLNTLDTAMMTLDVVQTDILTRSGAIQEAERLDLNERQKTAMRVLLENHAFSEAMRMTQDDIAYNATGERNGAAIKRDMAVLTRNHLAKSKTGRRGGMWLTQRGREIAPALK